MDERQVLLVEFQTECCLKWLHSLDGLLFACGNTVSAFTDEQNSSKREFIRDGSSSCSFFVLRDSVNQVGFASRQF